MHCLPAKLAFAFWQHDTRGVHLQRRLQQDSRRGVCQHTTTAAGASGGACGRRSVTVTCASTAPRTRIRLLAASSRERAPATPATAGRQEGRVLTLPALRLQRNSPPRPLPRSRRLPLRRSRPLPPQRRSRRLPLRRSRPLPPKRQSRQLPRRQSQRLRGRRSTLGPRWVNRGSPIFGGQPWVPAEN